jgi:hypothetical protein
LESYGYVIDASVAIKLFVIEEGSDQALSLFERLAADPPAIFLFQIISMPNALISYGNMCASTITRPITPTRIYTI